MKTIVITSFIFFSFSLASMEQTKQRKRRSELESLTNQETIIDKFLCEYGCGYVGSYRAVQTHERNEHRKYKIKKQEVEQVVTCASDTPDIPVEKKPTMLPSSPEKKIEPIPDQPYRVKPFDRHILTPEDCRQMSLAPFLMIQTIHERNDQKKQARLEKQKKEREDCNIPASWTCSECSKTFSAKNRYFCHLIMIHHYQFPEYEKDKAYLKRIERLMNTPYNESVIID